MTRILTYSTLYPNCKQPNHGIFVETRLRHLVETGQVESRVVAPVPWFPSDNPRFGRYACYSGVPMMESRNSLEIYHPKYVVIPKGGMTVTPMSLALASLPVMRKLKREFDFQLIDTHYFYPDGVAAALLAKWLDVPLVITARGSDINLIPKFFLPRMMIRWAAERAGKIITVSEALQNKLCSMSINREKIIPLRNGVDLKLFVPPLDRTALKAKMGVSSPLFLSVGNLVELKGHHLVISMMSSFPEAQLIIIGNGPERLNLERRAEKKGVGARVSILNAMPQKDLLDYYGVADCLLLASSREGWPNVLLEAMACGTPVVATGVGGVPEIIGTPAAGVIAKERSAKGLSKAVSTLFNNYPDRASTRRYSEKFGWADISDGQIQIFKNTLRKLC